MLFNMIIQNCFVFNVTPSPLHTIDLADYHVFIFS